MKVRFDGRKKDAIGITYTIETEVKANHIEEARLQLYERFDHISGVEEIKDFTPEKERFSKFRPVEVIL